MILPLDHYHPISNNAAPKSSNDPSKYSFPQLPTVFVTPMVFQSFSLRFHVPLIDLLLLLRYSWSTTTFNQSHQTHISSIYHWSIELFALVSPNPNPLLRVNVQNMVQQIHNHRNQKLCRFICFLDM